MVHNSFEHHHTLVVVNTSGKTRSVQARLSDLGLDFEKELFDNIGARAILPPQKNDHITLEIQPYGRLWIKNTRLEINRELLVELASDDDMKAALIA